MFYIFYIFYIFMTYNLHRKLKFIITRYFKNMCAPGGKIKMKK